MFFETSVKIEKRICRLAQIGQFLNSSVECKRQFRVRKQMRKSIVRLTKGVFTSGVRIQTERGLLGIKGRWQWTEGESITRNDAYLATERIHTADAGIVIVGGTLFSGRISQPRWPRALGPGPWRTGPEYQTAAFSHSRRVSSRLTHTPSRISRKIPDNYLGTRPSCDPTRFCSPARLGIEILWVLNATHFVRRPRICPSETATWGKLCKIEIEIFVTIIERDTITFYTYVRGALIFCSFRWSCWLHLSDLLLPNFIRTFVEDRSWHRLDYTSLPA